MNNLSLTFQALGDWNQARKLQESSLDLHERLFGNEHPETLKALNNLAVTLRN
jgi:hypothetical protein